MRFSHSPPLNLRVLPLLVLRLIDKTTTAYLTRLLDLKTG